MVKKLCNASDLLTTLEKIDSGFSSIKSTFLAENKIPEKISFDGLLIERGGEYPSFIFPETMFGRSYHTVYTKIVQKEEDMNKIYLKYADHNEFPTTSFPMFYFDFKKCQMYEVDKSLKNKADPKSVIVNKSLFVLK